MTRFNKGGGFGRQQRQREASVDEMSEECEMLRAELQQLCLELRDAELAVRDKDIMIDKMCKDYAAATGNDEIVRLLDTSNKPLPPPQPWGADGGAWGDSNAGPGFTGLPQMPMQMPMFGGDVGALDAAWKMGGPGGPALGLPSAGFAPGLNPALRGPMGFPVQQQRPGGVDWAAGRPTPLVGGALPAGMVQPPRADAAAAGGDLNAFAQQSSGGLNADAPPFHPGGAPAR